MSGIETVVQQRFAQEPFDSSWYIRDHRTGLEFSGGGDSVRTAGGAGRLLLMASFLDGVGRGVFHLGDPVLYTDRHRTNSTRGIMQWLEPEKQFAVRDALAQMVISGDSVGETLVTEYLESKGATPSELVAEFCEKVGVRLNSVGNSIVDVAVSNRDLVSIVDMLNGLRTGVRPSPHTVAIDASLAEEAINIMRSVLKTDGIAASLPGHGPFLAEVAHLPCDGGAQGKWSSTWSDTGIVFKKGQAEYSLSITCSSVPEDIDGVPGPYRARVAMADVGLLLW